MIDCFLGAINCYPKMNIGLFKMIFIVNIVLVIFLNISYVIEQTFGKENFQQTTQKKMGFLELIQWIIFHQMAMVFIIS